MAERRRPRLLAFDRDPAPATTPSDAPAEEGSGEPASEEERGSAERLRERQKRWFRELARYESRKAPLTEEPPRQP